MCDGSCTRFCAVSCLDNGIETELVLCGEDLLEGILDLGPGVVLEYDGQIRRQLIRVMPDLVLGDVVLVIVRKIRLHAVDSLLQSKLQCAVIRLHVQDVGVFSGIGGIHDHVGAALEHDRTGTHKT